MPEPGKPVDMGHDKAPFCLVRTSKVWVRGSVGVCSFFGITRLLRAFVFRVLWVPVGKKYHAAPTSSLATHQPCCSSSENRLTAGSSWSDCICLALRGCSPDAVAVGTGPRRCRAGWLRMGSQHGEPPTSPGSHGSRHRS